MRSRVAFATLTVLVLAGCASHSPPKLPLADEPTPSPPLPSYGPALCDNLLLFQLVAYGQTDPFLPPGFHARDPQAFLNSPAAFGQAGVIFMALDCVSAASGPLAVAFVGIFVEPPIVEGLEPAPLNFLELVRYTAANPFDGALLAAGWPLSTANVSVVSEFPAGKRYDAQALVVDGEGTVAMVAGTVGTPATNLGSPARFWYQDRGGLGYIEYNGTLMPSVGTGVCEVRAGTPLAAFVAAPLGVPPPVSTVAGDPTSCLGVNRSEPAVVLLKDLALNATFRRFPGAQAG